MRYILLLTFFACCSAANAQHKRSQSESLSWLRQKLISTSISPNAKNGGIPLCIECSEKGLDEIHDKDFTAKIWSAITGQQEALEVKNEISEPGKPTHTYTYHIPFSAITGASLTNCQPDALGRVNAYKERPLFIMVKESATTVSHVVRDKNGKVISGDAAKFTVNNRKGDWGLLIPVAINWDREPGMQNAAINAFRTLAGN